MRHAATPALPRSRAPARSFTLIELLVVLVIISTLLGIGVGVYFAVLRTTAFRAELQSVIAVVQAARGTARSERSETFVCVDPARRMIYPFGREKVGVWHFETLDGTVSPPVTPGAFGQAALVTGGSATLVDGKVGKALLFDGTVRLRCKRFRGGGAVNIPTYDAREGIAAEADVAPTQAGSNTLTVLSRDGWFGLSLAYDVPSGKFALSAFVVALDADGEEYLKWSAATAPILRMNEWTHVAMSGHRYGTGVTLTVNGVEQPPASSGSEAASAPSSTAETVIGATAAGGDPFHGRIDGLILSAYAVDTVHEMSGRVSLEAENLADGNTIRFDGSGALAAVHAGSAPRIWLKQYKGLEVVARVSVTVGPMGALDVSEPWYK